MIGIVYTPTTTKLIWKEEQIPRDAEFVHCDNVPATRYVDSAENDTPLFIIAVDGVCVFTGEFAVNLVAVVTSNPILAVAQHIELVRKEGIAPLDAMFQCVPPAVVDKRASSASLAFDLFEKI